MWNSRETKMHIHTLITGLLLFLLSGCTIANKNDRKVKWQESVDSENQLLPEDCPNWNQPINSYVSPEGEIQFGCVNAYNTARMVEDPQTLIRGRTIAKKDATTAGRAITDYEASKVKDLKPIKTETVTNNY